MPVGSLPGGSGGDSHTDASPVAEATGDAIVYPRLNTLANIEEARALAQAVSPPSLAPWDGRPTVQPIYDLPAGTPEAFSLVAALIVAGHHDPRRAEGVTPARAAAGMRLHNREWKAAIDEAIVAWTKAFNVAFLTVQNSKRYASGPRPADAPDGMLEAEAKQWELAQTLYDEGKSDQYALLIMVDHAFGGDARQMVAKAVDMLPVLDPRPRPPKITSLLTSEDGQVRRQHGRDLTDPRYRYHVAETTSFYLSLAAGRCQIHAHAPKALKGTFQGRCAAADGDEQLALVQIPPIYDSGLCMYGCPACMTKMCVKINIMTNAPLDISKYFHDGNTPSSMWDAAPAWHNEPAIENQKLTKACARHQNIGAPFTSSRLLSKCIAGRGGVGRSDCTAASAAAGRRLFEKSDVDAGHQTTRLPLEASVPPPRKRKRYAGELPGASDVEEDGPGPDSTDESGDDLLPGTNVPDPGGGHADAMHSGRQGNIGAWREHARCNRSVLIFDHPGIEAPLGTAPHRHVTMQHVLGFGDDELKLALEDVREERANETESRAMVRRQHHRLLQGQFARLVRGDSNGGGVDDCSIAALDALYPGVHKTVDVVLEGVDFCAFEHVLDIGLVRELVRGIGLMTGPLAQNDEFFSGARASGHAYCYVTGMGAGQLPGVKPFGIAERLHLDPIEGRINLYEWDGIVKAMWVFDALQWNQCGIRKVFGSNALQWYVHLGEGDEQIQIVGDYEPPLARNDWLDIRRLAVERTNELGWSAKWPSVPSILPLDNSGKYQTNHYSKQATNFIQVTAQQLMYWPKTRAQGLEVLTGNNLRGFIEACASTEVDVLGLAALAAMQAQGEEPEDSDAEGAEKEACAPAPLAFGP